LIAFDTYTWKKENAHYAYFNYRRGSCSPNLRTDKKGVLTIGLSEYRISKQKLRLSKDEAAKYDGSTRSGGFITAAWICASVTDAPEVL
jgi:hypothetical protein